MLTNITFTKSVRFSFNIFTQFLASFNNLTSSESWKSVKIKLKCFTN